MKARYVELVIRLQVESQLAYALRGDVLFGHLCRTYADILGDSAMDDAAAEYVRGNPWCVVSDARPEGYFPRPSVPLAQMNSSRAATKRQAKSATRKNFKKKIWVPRTMATTPLDQWGSKCVSSLDISERYDCVELMRPGSRLWVTVNRLTGEHGGGATASYEEWTRSIPLEVTVIVDTSQVDAGRVAELLGLVGLEGYGRWRTSGWGKFKILELFSVSPSCGKPGQSLLTLAPSAPQGQGMNPDLSWYQSFVHAGKLGPAQSDRLAGIGKTPLLLARTAAVFTPLDSQPPSRPFLGQPIGGEGRLSTALLGAIHQGYAPYVAIDLVTPNKPEPTP